MGRDQILIVDDEPDILRSTELLLNVLGYDAIPLFDASRVVDVAERHRPALILQDILMPGLDLPALMRDLRARPSTAEIPVVLFSASPKVAETAATLDASGYLTKPFEEAELRQLLRRTLGQRAVATPADALEGGVPPAMQALLHEVRNVVAALHNYVRVLEHAAHLGPVEAQAVEPIERLFLRLEERVERIRAEVRALAAPGQRTAPPGPA